MIRKNKRSAWSSHRLWRVASGFLLMGAILSNSASALEKRFIVRLKNPKARVAAEVRADLQIQSASQPPSAILETIREVEKVGNLELESAAQAIGEEHIVHRIGASSLIAVKDYSEAQIKRALENQGLDADEFDIQVDHIMQLDDVVLPTTEVRTLVIQTAGSTTRGVRHIRADEVWKFTKGKRPGGEPIKVAVVDTGVTEHFALKGRVLPGKSFHGNSTVDDQGHGTHVAGTIAGSGYGVAPEAVIIPVKALDSNGAGYESDAIAGVRFALDQGASVINLSIGWPKNQSDLSGWSGVLQDAQRRNVIVVAAAGNSRSPSVTSMTSPGRLSEPVTVGATDFFDNLATFSLRGNVGTPVVQKPDLCAPGVGILSSLNTGGEGKKNGTSMAAPHVSGTVALMLAAKDVDRADPKEILRVLTETTKSDTRNRDRFKFGDGVIDAAAAVQRFANPQSPSPVDDKHEQKMQRLAKVISDLDDTYARLKNVNRLLDGVDLPVGDNGAADAVKNHLDGLDLNPKGEGGGVGEKTFRIDEGGAVPDTSSDGNTSAPKKSESKDDVSARLEKLEKTVWWLAETVKEMSPKQETLSAKKDAEHRAMLKWFSDELKEKQRKLQEIQKRIDELGKRNPARKDADGNPSGRARSSELRRSGQSLNPLN